MASEALDRYFKQERGRRKRLAVALGIHPSAVSMWSRVPGERLGDVSRITGIPMQELRPDIFADARKKK
jgi:DNA-binding transcriptional regulator YdaS (Cro superfamily)